MSMNIPVSRLESLQDNDTRWATINWLNRNMTINNAGHRDLSQARNLLTMILREESKRR